MAGAAGDGARPDLRPLLHALESVRDGDFSARLPCDWTEIEGKIRGSLQRDRRLQRGAGRGAHARRARGRQAGKHVTRAIAAVAQGNLLQTVELEVDGRPLEGEFRRSATIVDTMTKQLGVFTSEVPRVAREVGTDGKRAASRR